jgi:hypothetical protein
MRAYFPGKTGYIKADIWPSLKTIISMKRIPVSREYYPRKALKSAA